MQSETITTWTLRAPKSFARNEDDERLVLMRFACTQGTRAVRAQDRLKACG
jgi:hypothetical protein